VYYYTYIDTIDVTYIRELSLFSRIDNIEVIYFFGKWGETEEILMNDWDFIITFFWF